MKIRRRCLSALLLAATLTVSSCNEGPLVQRRVPFNEAEFKWALGHGDGAVDGQAYIELKDHSVWYGKKTLVVIFPVNNYTTEFMTRRYEKGENLALADDRLDQYLTKVDADSQGRFWVNHLPPGEYYVGSTVDFNYYYYNDDGSKNWVYKYQYIYAQISVKNGYTTHVTHWNQCSSKLY
jgi:hypothetical protein